jgi:hypothetical protein
MMQIPRKNMIKKIIGFTLSSAVYLTLQGLLTLPVYPIEESQVPHLTLRIPIRKEPTTSHGWCESPDAKATGRPFGFNKIRYREEDDLSIEIFGCITNNSGQTFNTSPSGDYVFEVTITSPVELASVEEEDRFVIPLVPMGVFIPPGHTRYFGFLSLPKNTNTANVIIKQNLPPGQSKNNPPLQQLNITILR